MDDQTRISHSNWAKLKSQLKRHEGLSLKPYVDTTGHVSIGYGRNLDDRGISKGEAEVLLHNDMSLVEHEASNAFTWYDDLSDVRKCVVMNMVFNMGAPTVGKFKKMIQAIEEKRFDGAAQEMLDSKWAEQVGNRAKELADMMFTDRWPS